MNAAPEIATQYQIAAISWPARNPCPIPSSLEASQKTSNMGMWACMERVCPLHQRSSPSASTSSSLHRYGRPHSTLLFLRRAFNLSLLSLVKRRSSLGHLLCLQRIALSLFFVAVNEITMMAVFLRWRTAMFLADNVHCIYVSLY